MKVFTYSLCVCGLLRERYFCAVIIHLIGQAGCFFSCLAFGADPEDGAVRSHLKECLKTILNNNVSQVRICKPVIHIISRRENKLESCP